jgi:galactokinase
MRAASNAEPEFISVSCTCMRLLTVTGCKLAALPLQEALDSSRQERESSDAEWDARHQEAVDSAEQWKAFADKLTKEKEEQQQQLASASSELQVELMRLLLHVECLRHLICFSAAICHAQALFEQHHTKCKAT